VIDMLMRTLEFYGGDMEEIKSVLNTVSKEDTFVGVLEKAGDRKIFLGDSLVKSGDTFKAKDAYYKACIYFFLMEYFTDDLIESRKHYEKFMPVYNKFCFLASPKIERVEFPYKNGAIKAQFRMPEGTGPFPAIIFFQGNEGVKEHMISFEECALKRGMATLSVDPPGYGETRLTGIIWQDEKDYKSCVGLAVDYLYSIKQIKIEAIGIFGVSGGGLLSSYSASMEKRIAASAGLGCTSPYTFVKSWKNALISQKRKSFRYSGTDNVKDCYQWMLRCQKEILTALPQLNCPSLWVNGTDDLLVPIKDIQTLTEELGEKAEFMPIEGGDHLCSQFLSSGLADTIFDWFAEKLHNL